MNLPEQKKRKVEEKVVVDEALEKALDETLAITKFDALPMIFTKISELPRDLDDADLGQEVELASSCWGPSGFADIGPTATVFVLSVLPPGTEIDDEHPDDKHPDDDHPGLHASSESECGANCDYRDSATSDCDSIFSVVTCP